MLARLSCLVAFSHKPAVEPPQIHLTFVFHIEGQLLNVSSMMYDFINSPAFLARNVVMGLPVLLTQLPFINVPPC